MKIPMKKFYIIGTRYNSQFGTYLSKVKVATAKINKTCIIATFEEFGEKTSLKFEKASYTGVYLYKSESNDAYSSFNYLGYFDKSKAIAELQKWLTVDGSSKERAKSGIQLIEKE
jgi:hypothetical protein